MEEDKKLPDVLATCKKCQKVKVRNPAGFFGNGRDRRFVDQHGCQWNGRNCAECTRAKMRTHMKVKRSKDIQ